MRFLLSIFATVFICLMLTMCKHDPPPEPPPICQYDSSIEEMKKWYYFKTGTWWVYEEQTTGALDTVTVYFDQSFGEGMVGSFEWIANSSFDGYNYHYFFSSSNTIYCLNQPECDCHKVSRSKGMPGEFVGESTPYLWPIILGNYNNIVGYPNGQITAGITSVMATNLTQIINSETIFGIASFNVTTDQSIAGWPSEYRLAQNIGVVQRQHPHTNEVWVLINYYVIQ